MWYTLNDRVARRQALSDPRRRRRAGQPRRFSVQLPQDVRHRVTASGGARGARDPRREGTSPSIVTDQRMPRMTGVELLREVRGSTKTPTTVGIILTAFTDVDVLIEAINLGQVYRYITKPWDAKEVRGVLQYAIERYHLQRREPQARGAAQRVHRLPEPAAPRRVRQVRQHHRRQRARCARCSTSGRAGRADRSRPFCFAGETGTGKELVAHAIHINSPRSSRSRSCASTARRSPPGLLESELFGHEKGSFTGAVGASAGAGSSSPTSGTLFLDEVGDLPMEVQIKLLRTLQEREFERVGGMRDDQGRRPHRQRDQPQPRDR